MTSLYFEPGTGGHRAAFLTAVLLNGGDSWVVACPRELIDALDEEAKQHIAPAGPVRHVDIHTEYRTDFDAIRQQWALSLEIAEKAGCHDIFHPMIDLFVHYSPFLKKGTRRTSGIYFRPTMHYDGLSRKDQFLAKVKGILCRYFLSRRDGGVLFSLDRFLPAWASLHWKKARRVRFLPDLIPVSEDAVRIARMNSLERSDDRVRFLLFGALQRRKGIFEVLDAIEMLDKELASKCDFRFCGHISPDAAEFPQRLLQVAAECEASITLVDRFLSDVELAQEVASADIVLAPYQWHKGSSGVLYWAAAFGKPVIGQGFGLVGREIDSFSLGVAVKPGDVNALSAALSEVVRNNGLKVDSAQQRAYLSGHSAADFTSVIEEGLSDLSHELGSGS